MATGMAEGASTYGALVTLTDVIDGRAPALALRTADHAVGLLEEHLRPEPAPGDGRCACG